MRDIREMESELAEIVIETEQKPTLMIVDDSRVMRVSLKKILKNEFEIIEAIDGEDAWEKLAESPEIQGIFSDLSMPHLDGYGLLDRVRNSEEARIRDLPFIVITGKEGELDDLLEEVKSKGANDLVGKPFKTDDIISRTKQFLMENASGAAEETARFAAEAEAQRKAEEAARLAAEAEAQRKAEEAARLAAEAEAQRKAEEAARLAAEAEAQRKAEEESLQKAENDRLQLEEMERQEALEERASHLTEEEQASIEALRKRMRQKMEAQEQQHAEGQPFTPLQAVAVRAVLPLMVFADRLFKLGLEGEIAALRRRLAK